MKNTRESGQSGWTLYLDTDGNGQLGTGETSATTAADGTYIFDGLADRTTPWPRFCNSAGGRLLRWEPLRMISAPAAIRLSIS